MPFFGGRAKMQTIRRAIILALATALFGGIFIETPLGLRLEEEVGLAWLFKLRGPVAPPAEVLIVSMDREAARRLAQSPKISDWDRSLHAELIDLLVARGAAVIVFDVFFDEPRSASGDAKLAQAIARANRVVLIQWVRRDQHGDIAFDSLISPARPFAEAAIGLAPFPLPKIPNRVSRFWAFYPAAADAPTLPVVALQAYMLNVRGDAAFVSLAQELGVAQTDAFDTVAASPQILRDLMRQLRTRAVTDTAIPGQVSRRVLASGSRGESKSAIANNVFSAMTRTYQGPDNYLLNFYGPPGTFNIIPYSEFLAMDRQPAPPQDLTGKVVFVGNLQLSFAEQHDGFFTVFSRDDGVDISGVEIGATAFANLLQNRSLRPIPGTVFGFWIAVIFGALVGSIGYCIAGIPAVWVMLATSGVYVGLAFLLFVRQNLWLPLSTPLAVQVPLALFLGYLWQYLGAKQAREKFSDAMGKYVPARLVHAFDAGKEPTTTPELVYGTCMATDVGGYTTLSETLAAAELADLTREYFALLGECVAHQQGEMLEVRGDGMNTVWSAPEPKRQDRLRACLAAIEIIEAVGGFNEHHPDRQFPTRIGLHAGKIALGSVGGGDHLAYSVIGDIMNTASRIEELSKHLDTRLLASEPVVQDLDELLVRSLGSFILKGKTEALSIVEILDRRESASEQQRDLCSRFKKALGAYVKGDCLQAETMFESLLSAYPADGPSRFYLLRCRHYKASAPKPEELLAVRMQVK